MSLFILPYNPNSVTARALAEELNVKRIKHSNSKWKPGIGKVVLNWGMAKVPAHVEDADFINKPEAVALASNKIETFKALQKNNDINIPPFTEDKEEATFWLKEGAEVVCRTVLNGHSGEGIVLASSVEELVDAPLYTKYVKKRHEYRVHVFNGSWIDVQRKARSRETEDENVNWKIRNCSNGFIYSRDNISASVMATRMAKRAISTLGLDFGAVDIIHNESLNKYFILEVNTAPGLTGTTLANYVNAIQNIKSGTIGQINVPTTQNSSRIPSFLSQETGTTASIDPLSMPVPDLNWILENPENL